MLNACAAFSLKDAARRDRLGASTFRALAKGLLAAAALHIAVQGAAAAVAARGALAQPGVASALFALAPLGCGAAQLLIVATAALTGALLASSPGR